MASDPSSTSSNRITLESSRDQHRPGRLKRVVDTLSDPFRQSIQTRSATPSLSIHRSRINTVEPAEGVDEYYEVYKTTAIVFASISNFASDVWEPGYRIESDSDNAVEWFEDEWLPQAAVLHGGKHNDFLPFGKHTTIQRRARGGALIEHVRANPDDPDSLITGLNFIPPETVSFVPYDHKPILVEPDPPQALREELPESLPETRRGELPAYIQYHRNAPQPTSRNPIPLSQNDVTRTIYNGDAAGVGTDLTNFWGTPVTEIVAEDVAGFKNILRDKEQAIKNKAYGLWQLSFGREILEYTETDQETGETWTVEKIIEWDEEGKTNLVDEIENDMGPGSILTHDGEVELDRLDGEVPDLIDDLEFYISNITSALPTPLYIIGFEENINQFVTEHQNERYQRLIDWEREELERTFTEILEAVAESTDEIDPEWVQFKIEPPEEESPVMSMSDEDVERLSAWATAFKELRGDIPVDMFIDPADLRELILQLPADAEPDLAEADLETDDEAVQEMAAELGDLVDGAGGSSTADTDSESDASTPDLTPPSLDD